MMIWCEVKRFVHRKREFLATALSTLIILLLEMNRDILVTGLPNSMSAAEEQNKKKRAKKQPFTIKFDSEVDFGKRFSRGRVMPYTLPPLVTLHVISSQCQHCTPAITFS